MSAIRRVHCSTAESLLMALRGRTGEEEPRHPRNRQTDDDAGGGRPVKIQVNAVASTIAMMDVCRARRSSGERPLPIHNDRSPGAARDGGRGGPGRTDDARRAMPTMMPVNDRTAAPSAGDEGEITPPASAGSCSADGPRNPVPCSLYCASTRAS